MTSMKNVPGHDPEAARHGLDSTYPSLPPSHEPQNDVFGLRMKHRVVVSFIALIAVALVGWYLNMSNTASSATLPAELSATAEKVAPATRGSLHTRLKAKKSSVSTFRDNSEASLTKLHEGTWRAGIDIAPGRYHICAGQGSGTITSVKAGGQMGLNETFATVSLPGGRVHTITTDISKGETVTITGLEEVTFTPAAQVMSTTISAGTWIVGFDVPAGDFTAAAPHAEEQGSIEIRVDDAVVSTSNVGRGTDAGTTSMPLHLTEGQTLVVRGLNEVTLEKAEDK